MSAGRGEAEKPRDPLARGRRRLPDEIVRYTLDLERPQHRFLRQFAVSAEADASVVMRALLVLLEEDPALGRRIVKKISASRGW